MEGAKTERGFLTLFDAGLYLKIVFSVFEVVTGILVIAVPRIFFEHAVLFATAGEIAEDPGDLVANLLRHAAHSFAIHTHYVLAFYLILYGALKIGLCVLILREVKAAYPWFVVVVGFFAAFSAYRAVATNNPWLSILVLLDLVLMLLAVHEYRIRYSS